jgi:metal-responsive CopG/Arc/MetJ family transcriptional regulator
MPQINLNSTPELARDLKRLMRERGFRTKSEAIRAAVREAVTRLEREPRSGFSFRSLIGAANLVPANPHPRFQSDGDLWKEG